MAHGTMAFTPTGLPLGLIDLQSWARDPKDFGKRHRRKQLPIEQKESFIAIGMSPDDIRYFGSDNTIRIP